MPGTRPGTEALNCASVMFSTATVRQSERTKLFDQLAD
ncbi:hypothetical protein ACPOL_6351 [Acidisarcina polymorpha]|uniref:Uncharacterized protein n=1 Tax=Acidisarcina polymorpha TaxID=2211140 RepID=A0A2Z5GAG7_9BACT|nr:hypothetical protein ACPOL_6351 [Acidisarcina polymorpha]